MPRLLFPTAFGPCGLAWNDAGLTAFVLPGRDAADTEAWLARLGGAPDAAANLETAPPWVRDLVGSGATASGRRIAGFRRGAARPEPGVRLRLARLCGGADDPGRPDAHLWRPRRHAGEPPGSSRAIGAVDGRQSWPLIVPCHRIIGARGRLTGFSSTGGVRTKARLLALEGAQLLAE